MKPLVCSLIIAIFPEPYSNVSISAKVYTLRMRFSGGAKLILYGEYSSLLGYPALVARLPQEIELSRTNTPHESHGPEKICGGHPLLGEFLPNGYLNYLYSITEKILMAYSDDIFAGGPLDKKKNFKKASEAISSAIAQLTTLVCSSSIPQKAGFGSSAALSVAIARYIMHQLSEMTPELFSDEKSLNSIIRTCACRFEDYFHGRASGIDTIISASPVGSVLKIHPDSSDSGKNTEYFKKDLALQANFHVGTYTESIVYCSLYRSGETKDRISHVLATQEAAVHEMGRIITQNLSDPSSKILTRQNVTNIYNIQVSSGIANAQESSFIQDVSSACETVGKISGAGGACFFLADGSAHQHSIVSYCTKIIQYFTDGKKGFVGKHEVWL